MKRPSIEIFEIRTPLYGWLATFLSSEPSLEALEKAKYQLPLIKEKVAIWDDPDLGTSFQNFLKALSQSNPEDLAVDYAGLFLGGKEGLICPSESSYLEKRVYGEATLKIMELYGQQGFVKEGSFLEPDDHISVECAFMSVLGCNFIDIAKKEGMDSPRCQNLLDLQLKFLSDHLLKWIPVWAQEVKDFSETDFYRDLAGLAQALVEADQRLLTYLLPPFQNPKSQS